MVKMKMRTRMEPEKKRINKVLFVNKKKIQELRVSYFEKLSFDVPFSMCVCVFGLMF